MPSAKGRVVQSWRTPERKFVKAIAVCYDRMRWRGSEIIERCDRIIPHWREYFPAPPTDNAPVQRADKARRYPREFETLQPYWWAALEAATAGRPLGKRAVWTIAAACAAQAAQVLGGPGESAGKRGTAAAAVPSAKVQKQPARSQRPRAGAVGHRAGGGRR